ncbi:hypothetical protein OIU81_02975 [Streptomyces sp. NBC_01454]|uniref:hypothetical protein n=1 Tax=Streptomyces sp. NBC_01454 TaxID=2975867 RepID=UPI002E3810EA|nr:hypothetical protein [Streptomyces sp. NBC_01454]
MPSITDQRPRTETEQAQAIITKLRADIANMRGAITSGQVPDTEIYTLEHGISERQQRIARLQSLI